MIAQEIVELDLGSTVFLPFSLTSDSYELRLSKFYGTLASGSRLSEAIGAARALLEVDDGGAFSSAAAIYESQPLRIIRQSAQPVDGKQSSPAPGRDLVLDPTLPIGCLAPENLVERALRLIRLIERTLFAKREACERALEDRRAAAA